MKHIIEHGDYRQEDEPNTIIWVEFTNLGDKELVHMGLYSDEYGRHSTVMHTMKAWVELTREIINNAQKMKVDEGLVDAMKKLVDDLSEGKNPYDS